MRFSPRGGGENAFVQAAIRSPLPLTDMNGPGIVKAGRISLALAVYVPSLSSLSLPSPLF